MVVKKLPQALSIDPAVEVIMTSGSGTGSKDPVYRNLAKVKRARNMTAAKKKRAEQDAARVNALIDMPQDLLDALDWIASELSVPRSQVASRLMIAAFLQLCENEGWQDWEKDLSRSMRFEFNLVMPDLPGGIREKGTNIK